MSSGAGAAPPGWSPPAELEEYRVLRLLGQGAMGQVYLAEDQLLDRPVAIKFLGATASSRIARERFFIEARAIARLQHPNVVAVYRVGEVSNRPYFVSEYVSGQSLDRLDKPLPWQRVLAIGIELARGLSTAHRRGVLHRDIKPANAIISDDGEVKLLDFGLAELSPRPGLPLPPTPSALDARGGAPAAPVDLDGTVSLPPDDEGASAGHANRVTRPLDSTEPAGARGLVGTPIYMAPELWAGEPASTRSDVYSFGVLLYELCAGRPPHDGQSLVQLASSILGSEAAPLAVAAPAADPRLAAVVDRCLRRDPAERYASGEALREALEQAAAQIALAGAVPEGNPYRGLLAFEAEHRGLFFGRAAEVRILLDRLRAGSFVLVAGDSGVGKSSLCRAGVLPAWAESRIEAGADRRAVALILGRRPVEALSAALAPLFDVPEAKLAEQIRSDPEAVARHRRDRRGGALIFIDQLEELCILADPIEAAAVASALHALGDASSGVRVLATARSDFLGRLASLPGLGDDLASSLYLLRPLAPDQLREAIVAPARAKGYAFESDALVDALVGEASSAAGGLPLLQFALAELWEARDDARRRIPASALESVGGVAGALARHADGLLGRLPLAQRAAAQAILIQLVTAEGTRARRPEGELLGVGEGARGALDALVRGRILVARETDAGEEGAYEIAHEALVTGWDTLRGWLRRDADTRAVRRRLEQAAAEWERLGRSRDALWGGRQLGEAARIAIIDLAARDRAFLLASRRAARQQRLGRWGAALGLPLVAALTAGGVRIHSASEVNDKVAQHLSEARRALDEGRGAAAAMIRARDRAFADFDEDRTSSAEASWADALKLYAAADDADARACQAFEIALQLASGRGDVRDQLADALLERALLGEQMRRFSQIDELIRRLAAYDEGGARLRRWEAPAHLAVESSPPGAPVSIARLDPRGDRCAASSPEALGATPVAERDLPPGSVLLELALPGRATVRLPLLLRRDEHLRVSVPLPPAAAVPAGFAYVPPGRFLFGSTEDEAQRVQSGRQPIHAVETGAFLIARHETTLGDYIAYLRALSEPERATRAPRAREEFHSLTLTEEAGRYRLSLSATTHAYSALEGDPIHFGGRKRRADQDWSRLPVAAITFDDALAYLRWLDATGRVPGARLCGQHEWERAARGADDRIYPSGDRIDPDDADYEMTYGRDPAAFGPDEVGSHPGSVSPFGVLDLAGNVWEWTAPFSPSGEPVLRSGSWYQLVLDSRAINFEKVEPSLRSALIGVRVCATAPAAL